MTRGVLFDVDGTLIDNSYFHAVAWFRALREHDITVPMRRLHRLVGMGGDMLTRELCGEERPDLDKAHGEQMKPFFDEMVPVPGAHALLEHCHQRGLKVVLASSAGAKDLERLVDIVDAKDLVDVATSSSDADRSKPAPDIVSVALSRSGLTPDNAVFIGDTRWDIEASGRAGVRCIAVETG